MLCRCGFLRHELRQRRGLMVGEREAELGAAPQHILGGLRPLLCHQVVHLRLRERRTEPDAEIGSRAGVTQNVLRAVAVGGGEPTRIVTSGGPDLGRGPLSERAKIFRESQCRRFRPGASSLGFAARLHITASASMLRRTCRARKVDLQCVL